MGTRNKSADVWNRKINCDSFRGFFDLSDAKGFLFIQCIYQKQKKFMTSITITLCTLRYKSQKLVTFPFQCRYISGSESLIG